MKIGVLGCFYNCADLLPHVLEPWVDLQQEGHEVVFNVIHAQFAEYAELGFANSDAETVALLRQNEHLFAELDIADRPLSEKEARSRALSSLLKHDVDLVWLLDGDEVYTKKQILDILSFIEHTSFDYYHVHLRNRIFDTIQWKDDYFPPRVFRTNRHGGLREFAWDNELIFNDGTPANNVIPGIVPKHIAYVNHFTWRRKDAAQKIAYHKKHFGYAMYTLEENGNLVPDPEYFALHKIPLPVVEEDGSIARSPKPILDVILRSHTTGNFREGAVRVTDDIGGKSELALRTVRSIVEGLLMLERLNDYEIHFTIVDDHSDEVFLKRVQEELKACPFEVTIVPLTERGNEASMKYALEYARNRKQDFIYFVEDDYLHENTIFLEMLHDWKQFSKNLGKSTVALFPVDYPDYYLPNLIALTRVVPGSRRHWRISYSTTCTFFIPRSLLDAQWDYFAKIPEVRMSEGESINNVWQNHAVLFSPLPTLAFHMHHEETMPPFSNWRKLWDTLEKPLYV